MEGALKLLFPHRDGSALQAMIVNSAGGITGGDRFTIEAHAEAGAALTLTTQACERAYRAQPGEVGELKVRLVAEAGGRLEWLPQETILFQCSALRRHLRVDLAADAQLLLCEPIILGRAAMGEAVTQAFFADRVEIFRDGRALFIDATRLSGDLAAQMDNPAVGRGARAMALVAYVAPNAEAERDRIRAMWADDPLAGVSLIAPDTLVARVLASDGFALRQRLLPVLDRLTGNTLPRSWRL